MNENSSNVSNHQGRLSLPSLAAEFLLPDQSRRANSTRVYIPTTDAQSITTANTVDADGYSVLRITVLAGYKDCKRAWH